MPKIQQGAAGRCHRDSPDAVACIHTCTSSAGHTHGHQSLHPRACRLHMSGSLGSKSFYISVMLWHAKKWDRVGLVFFFNREERKEIREISV